MKILLYTFNFYPDCCSNAYIFSSLCSEFVKLGHEVTVVASTPMYDSKINNLKKIKRFKKGNFRWSYEDEYNGARIYYIKTISSKKNNVKRLWSFYAFKKRSFKLIKKLNLEYDAVFSQTPPPLLGNVLHKIAKRRNAKDVFVIQDLLFSALFRKGKISKFVYDFLSYQEGKTLKKVFKIVTISSSMKREIEQKYNFIKAEVITNFADVNYDPMDKKELRKKYGLPLHNFVVSYVGNLGNAQDLLPLINYGKNHKDNIILIAGNGTKFDYYKEYVLNNKIKNINFFGYVDKKTAHEITALSDVSCIMLAKHVTTTSFPSKLYSIMAAGVPVLYSGIVDSDIANFITENNIGYVADILDKHSFEKTLEKMIGFDEKGKNAHMLWEQNFTPRKIALKYLKLVKKD